MKLTDSLTIIEKQLNKIDWLQAAQVKPSSKVIYDLDEMRCSIRKYTKIHVYISQDRFLFIELHYSDDLLYFKCQIPEGFNIPADYTWPMRELESGGSLKVWLCVNTGNEIEFTKLKRFKWVDKERYWETANGYTVIKQSLPFTVQ